MVRFFHNIFLHQQRRVTAIILAFAFYAGILAGAFFALLTDTSYFLMMRTAANYRVSIAVLLPSAVLPLLFSAFAVYISQSWLLIPIAFLKAFLFGFLSFGLITLNSDSGWLLRFMVMFTDCLATPVLFWFWIRCCDAKQFFTATLCAAFLLITGISLLDYQYISPFLVNLLS